MQSHPTSAGIDANKQMKNDIVTVIGENKDDVQIIQIREILTSVMYKLTFFY